MTYCYQMIDDQYVWCAEGIPSRPPLAEVALAFDRECGTVHKHGDPELVHAWHRTAQRQFRIGGFDALADDLVVISGRFDLEELNRCITVSGYAATFYAQLMLTSG